MGRSISFRRSKTEDPSADRKAIVRNLLEKTTLEALRNNEYKDVNGNIITEPDLANPTRPRWERPLDTIRSFEKAIDGGYQRRSMSRAGSDFDGGNQAASRRTSYYGYDSGPSPVRHQSSAGGYYNSRRSEYFDPYGQAPNAAPSRNRFGRNYSGNFSENRNSYYGNGYGQHSYNQSYDAAAGSDSTGPWNSHTDPSSENSSLDRANGIMKPVHTPDPMNGYAMDQYGNDAIMEEGGSDDYGYPTNMRRGQNVPLPPQHSTPPPRKTIQLGGGGGSPQDSAFASQGGSLPSTARPTPTNEKRKSFFGRKFGKNKD
ncbi:hypothetical protein MBLNU457_7821t2 [Dothideomycetes sp. NU457]